MSKKTSAKISRPKITGIFERERLFHVLDSARERPVVWLASPAGSGKTTLVSSYIDARNLKCLWYQVDEGDNDIATFFYYMSLAGQQANRRKKKPLPLLTPEYLAGIPTFSRRFFEDLFSRLQPPFVLVFDNYQEADDDAQLQEVIRNGLNMIPPGINVIIISRTNPPPQMSSFKVSKTIRTLGWDQLRLQRDELQGIVDLDTQRKLQDDEISELHRQTDGWTAGLVLLLEQDWAGAAFGPLPRKEVHQEIFDYFAAEIFSRLNEQTRDFLMKTALFPVMTAETVSRLTGFDKPAQVFSFLCKKNYFTVKRPGKEPEYQYHPLFREFLLRKVRDEVHRGDIRPLRKKAGAIMEWANQAEAAADLYIAAEDWDSLGRLVQEQALSFVQQGRIGLVETWLQAIPEYYRQEQPWLSFWLGECRKVVDPDNAKELFAHSYQLFKAQDSLEGIFLSWAGLAESFVLAWSDFTELDEWIKEIEEILQAHNALPSVEIEARVVYGVFCVLMYRQPHHRDLAFWEERLRKIVFSSTDLPLKIRISSHLIFYYTWWSGEQAKAMLLVNMLRSAVDSTRIDPLTSIMWKSIEAAYHWMTADNRACLEAVESGLELAESTGIYIWNFMLSAQASFGAMTSGNVDAAGPHLRMMASILQTNRKLDFAHYHYHLGWEALWRNNLNAAHEYMKTAVVTTQEAGVNFIHAFSLMGLAEVLIELEQFEQADEYLRQAREMGLAMKSNTVEYQYQWLTAFQQMKQGQNDLALESMRKHLQLSRKHGILSHACWRSPVMQQLYEMALEAEIDVDHVQLLIRRHTIVPDPPPSHLYQWPWAIKVTTLGEFSIQVDGEPLKFSGKAQKKPLELLQAIIAYGGEEVRDELLTEALWPDSDGDMAIQSYRTTISRLRRLLGHEKAIITGSGRIGLDRRYVWTDVWAFEHTTENDGPDNDRSADENPPQLDMLLKKMELYPGEFLPACNYHWAIPMRERVRNRYLNTINEIGSCLEEAGDIELAVKYYRKGLEVDKLVEGLYQRLIICYGELGRGAEALRVFNDCREALAMELGIEPSKKTDEIVRRYMHVSKQ